MGPSTLKYSDIKKNRRHWDGDHEAVGGNTNVSKLLGVTDAFITSAVVMV